MPDGGGGAYAALEEPSMEEREVTDTPEERCR
jgi:hypothetical protein